MASNLDLDESVPQWKKELILRKRAQSQNPSQLSARAADGEGDTGALSAAAGGTHRAQRPASQQQQTVGCNAPSTKRSTALSQTKSVTDEVCDTSAKVSVKNELELKMVQDSVLVMRAPVATNGDCFKNNSTTNGGSVMNSIDDDSDTSEELQYGPGIVSKLKSKYLSLTLRETNAKPRPSILNLRRATSLENMLDAEDSADESQPSTNGRRATVSSGSTSGVDTDISVSLHQSRRYTPRNGTGNSGTRYRTTTRGNESVKRARSVETLVRSQSQPEDIVADVAIRGNDSRMQRFDSTKKPAAADLNTAKTFSNCNGGQRVNRPKRIAPIMDETERPPADHVKQTLMIFEGPALRRTKAPRTTGEVASKVANFKLIIDHEKQINNNPSPGLIIANNTKKPLGPKPHISSPKPALPKRGSPVKRPLTPTTSLEKDTTTTTTTRVDSPELTTIKSPVNLPVSPPMSPQIPDVSRDTTGPDPDSNRPRTRPNTTLSETPDLIVHSSPARVLSPGTVKTITADFIKEEVKNTFCLKAKASEVNSNNISNSDKKSVVKCKSKDNNDATDSIKSMPTIRSPSPSIPNASQQQHTDTNNKEITKQAVENISEAGMSITYQFSDTVVSKSHLPRLNTIPVRINRLVADTPSSKPSTPVKTNGTHHPTRPAPIPSTMAPSIPLPTSPEPTPLALSPSIVSATNKHIPKVRPPTPQTKSQLTSREIEKNSINKQKTLEQPVSKVVVSMRSVDEVVANKSQVGGRGKSRAAEQTTILFNFQTRDTIPDYIATDGSTNVRRGKREKPKPGESGIILLPGAPAEEFADDDEDWMLSLNGPPSPCDVYFVNDNILIDGRSSISKQPKRQKMRIQFDDDATQVFEYMSEASLMEDPTSSTITTPPERSHSPGHTVPSLTGSSLASYTPSKMSVTADFQLGVTRTQPVLTPPTMTTSSSSVSSPASLEPELLQPVTYSAETNADILF